MKRFWNNHHMGIGIAVAALLLAAILVLSVQIRQVTVSGSSRYTPEQMEEFLFSGKWGRQSILVYLQDRLKPHKQIPFVEDYKLVFHGPFHVEVIIYDKSIVGYVSYMSSFMYFDRDGMIVESSTKKLSDVPWVTGLEFGSIVLYKPLPVEDTKVFGEILNLTQQLSVYQIPVEEIHYDIHGVPSLIIGEMEVTLGSNADIDGKISTLNDILRDQPQLKEIPGTLKLDGYSETNSRAGITFKRK